MKNINYSIDMAIKQQPMEFVNIRNCPLLIKYNFKIKIFPK